MHRTICCLSTDYEAGSVDWSDFDGDHTEDVYKCETCGEVQTELVVAAELDELDEMLGYFAEAPIGEPPAPSVEYWETPPSPITRKHAATALTAREREIAGLVAEGRANKEIAQVFGTAEQTVKNQISSVLSKLGLENRTQLALWYFREAA